MTSEAGPEPRLAFSPSLNQAVIAHLPGLPTTIAGTRAADWLSSVGIARRMTARGLGAGLVPVPEGAGIAAIHAAPPFARQLEALVEGGRPDALALADEIGTALGALLSTLSLGPAGARVARPDWPAAHWARWAAVRRVVIGGGLVSGSLGRLVIATAKERLPGFGVEGVEVSLADDPATLVLRGAGIGLPDGPAVLVDAGHTSVKSALADIAAGQPARLRMATPVAASSLMKLQAAGLADRLAELANATAADEHVASFGLAIATYTDPSGQPYPGQASAYGSLAEVHLVEHLGGRVAGLLGHPIVVRAGGDGASSAAAVRGRADAAIVLGTAIGSGLNV